METVDVRDYCAWCGEAGEPGSPGHRLCAKALADRTEPVRHRKERPGGLYGVVQSG